MFQCEVEIRQILEAFQQTWLAEPQGEIRPRMGATSVQRTKGSWPMLVFAWWVVEQEKGRMESSITCKTMNSVEMRCVDMLNKLKKRGGISISTGIGWGRTPFTRKELAACECQAEPKQRRLRHQTFMPNSIEVLKMSSKTTWSLRHYQVQPTRKVKWQSEDYP